MKKKLTTDLFVYIATPILLCNVFDDKYLIHVAIISIIICIIYSIVSIRKIRRINVSASIIFIIYLVINLLKKNIISDYHRYIYDTGSLIVIAILIIIANYLGKNVVREVYQDALKSGGYSILCIYSVLKKNNVDTEFNKLSNLILMNMLFLSFLKVYSIGVYGEANYYNTSSLEMLVELCFLTAELYFLNLIVLKTKSDFRSYDIKKNRRRYKSVDDKKRIISLIEYKEVNK